MKICEGGIKFYNHYYSIAMLENRITQLNERIKDLDIISGINKKMSEYSEISYEIEECKTILNQLEDQMNDTLNSKKDQISQITDDTFTSFMKDISNDIQKFDANGGLEDKITEYKKILDKITICENYLQTQKFEVVYVDELNNK